MIPKRMIRFIKQLKNVIQTTEGKKNLDIINVDVHEILRRFAPLNDNTMKLSIYSFSLSK